MYKALRKISNKKATFNPNKMAAFNLFVRKIRNEFKIQKIVDVIKGKID